MATGSFLKKKKFTGAALLSLQGPAAVCGDRRILSMMTLMVV